MLFNSNILRIKKILYILFFVFVFFPFLSPIRTNTDMQPYSVVLAFLLFPFFKFSLSKNQFLILLISIFSFIVFIYSGPSFATFRSLYNYISIFVIYYISNKILKERIFKVDSIIKYSFYVWIVIGLLQSTIKRDLFVFLLSDARTTENRGVTSLAPEPTFFAIILIFFFLFIFYLNFHNQKKFYFMIIFSVLFLAKSSMGTLYLFVLFIYYLFTKLSIRFFFLSILVIFSLSFSMSYFYDSRLYGLALVFIENPSNLLLLDASINDRFFQIYFSLKGFFHFFLLPHGFSSWGNYLVVEIPKYADYVLLDYSSSDSRIMSGLGSLLFELGFIGLLLPFVIVKFNLLLFKNNTFGLFFVLILIFLLLVSAIPIGFSYFGFYLALIEYLSKERSIIKT